MKTDPGLVSRETLTQAAELFRERPVLGNAIRYRNIALQYWEDGVINDEGLLQTLHEIRDN